MSESPGRVIIVSGPSGAGKSTLVRRLLEYSPAPLVLSVSATTRPPRSGEKDGVHYHFLSREAFTRLREENAFLECFEVFGRGYWYGTLQSEVEAGLKAGKWVILEIDVDGAAAAAAHYPDAVSFFIWPGSFEELEDRLRKRSTNTPEDLARRLEVARRERAAVDRYHHVIVNQDIEQAVRRMSLLLGEAAADHPTGRGD